MRLRQQQIINLAWLVVIAAGVLLAGVLLWQLALALWFDRATPFWLRAAMAGFYFIFSLFCLFALYQRVRWGLKQQTKPQPKVNNSSSK